MAVLICDCASKHSHLHVYADVLVRDCRTTSHQRRRRKCGGRTNGAHVWAFAALRHDMGSLLLLLLLLLTAALT
jgi:hypothetical protein